MEPSLEASSTAQRQHQIVIFPLFVHQKSKTIHLGASQSMRASKTYLVTKQPYKSKDP
jgi:hypothetical protein